MRGIMGEGNRRGWGVIAGAACSVWAVACAEPDDWELTEIAADEQAELFADEEVEAPERTPGVGSTIGAHSWISSGVVQPSWTQVLEACPGTSVRSLTATRTGPGGLDLALTLPEAEFAGGSEDNALPTVSGYGTSSSHCALVSWDIDAFGTAEAVVRCFDGAGAQVDASTTPFTFSLTNKETPGGC